MKDMYVCIYVCLLDIALLEGETPVNCNLGFHWIVLQRCVANVG